MFIFCSYFSPSVQYIHIHQPSVQGQCGSECTICFLKGFSEVRFWSSVHRNGPELSPHAQVLADDRHQSNTRHINQPPRQGCGEVSIIDPAANHVEEMNCNCEVQALLPTTDEEPQTQSTCQRVQNEGHHREPSLCG